MTSVPDELDPRIGALLRATFARSVDVEVAARHLWAIDREAAQRAGEGSSRVRRAMAAALAAVVLTAVPSTAVAASQGTLPGDVLYPVKLTAERARLLIALSPDRDALVLLDIAERRLGEAERAVSERPDAVDGLLTRAEQAVLAASSHPHARRVGQQVAAARDRVTVSAGTTSVDPDRPAAEAAPAPPGQTGPTPGGTPPAPAAGPQPAPPVTDPPPLPPPSPGPPAEEGTPPETATVGDEETRPVVPLPTFQPSEEASASPAASEEASEEPSEDPPPAGSPFQSVPGTQPSPEPTGGEPDPDDPAADEGAGSSDVRERTFQPSWQSRPSESGSEQASQSPEADEASSER